MVDPCIPDDWKEFSVKRLFRNVSYRIHVINKSKTGSPKKYISVNGKIVAGNTIPIIKKGEVKVEVFL